jgi:hypothetical protein
MAAQELIIITTCLMVLVLSFITNVLAGISY